LHKTTAANSQTYHLPGGVFFPGQALTRMGAVNAKADAEHCTNNLSKLFMLGK